MQRFSGKLVIVTGAASGIGEAIARRFAAEGANLALCDLDEPGLQTLEATLEGSATEMLSRKVDVTDGDALEAFVSEAAARFGRIDTLVNNAGGGAFGNVEALSKGEWDHTMALSLDSAFHSCRVAIPHLKKTRGSIVNIASVAGLFAEFDVPAYCAAKAGLLNLTRAMAWNSGPDGVRVNAVAPGATATRNMEWMWGNGELREFMQAAIPLRRWAQPADIAAAVTFLASDDASFITGAHIVVDGGMSLGTGSPRLSSLLPSAG